MSILKNLFGGTDVYDSYRKQMLTATGLQLRNAVENDLIDQRDMQRLLHDIERSGFTREQIEDGLIPDMLKRKIQELEAKHEQEKIAARTAAMQAVLNAPHMQCTLSTAVNLWIVKFGDGWVPRQDLGSAVGEMNWHELGARLKRTGKLEEYEDFWRIIT